MVFALSFWVFGASRVSGFGVVGFWSWALVIMGSQKGFVGCRNTRALGLYVSWPVDKGFKSCSGVREFRFLVLGCGKDCECPFAQSGPWLRILVKIYGTEEHPSMQWSLCRFWVLWANRTATIQAKRFQDGSSYAIFGIDPKRDPNLENSHMRFQHMFEKPKPQHQGSSTETLRPSLLRIMLTSYMLYLGNCIAYTIYKYHSLNLHRHQGTRFRAMKK